MAVDMLPALRVAHLRKSFGQDTILQDISLEVSRGEVLVVLGPSGCGKSTLLRCLVGLEDIDSGEIWFGNESLQACRHHLYLKIGMVFQSYDLFDHLNVLRNITLAPIRVRGLSRAAAEREALDLLERFGLSDKRTMFQRQLSGGQRQRVAIIRALCMHPEIMLLDEITAALDPEMVHEVLDLVLELACQGQTMIIVTHEMEFARAIADRILFLDGGRVAEEAPAERFFTLPKSSRAREFLSGLRYERRSHPGAAEQ